MESNYYYYNHSVQESQWNPVDLIHYCSACFIEPVKEKTWILFKISPLIIITIGKDQFYAFFILTFIFI